MLQRAFDRICSHRRIIKGTGRAANLAIDIIDMYHRGYRTERRLVDLFIFAWEMPFDDK